MKKNLVNEEINFPSVMIVSESKDSENLVMSSEEALQSAYDQGLDLVCISTHTQVPVCKIIDYGKFKYQLEKKEKENHKKHKLNEVMKEVKFNLNISDHDKDFKIKHIKEFLEKGFHVKITIVMKGRQTTHPELGSDLINSVFAEVKDLAKVEKPARQEGRFFRMLLSAAV